MRKNLKLCPTKQYECWAVTQAADKYLKILRTFGGNVFHSDSLRKTEAT